MSEYDKKHRLIGMGITNHSLRVWVEHLNRMTQRMRSQLARLGLLPSLSPESLADSGRSEPREALPFVMKTETWHGGAEDLAFLLCSIYGGKLVIVDGNYIAWVPPERAPWHVLDHAKAVIDEHVRKQDEQREV